MGTMNSSQQAALVSWVSPVVGFVLIGLSLFSRTGGSYAGASVAALVTVCYVLATLGLIAGILALMRSPLAGQAMPAVVGLILCCLLFAFLFSRGTFAFVQVMGW
jgi:hypothetical protein